MANYNIVLFQPEIPANTGNIARTCIGFNANLHLIKPYGFTLNDKKIKRAGLDYWPFLKLFEYDDFNDFLNKNKKANIFIITKFGKNLLSNIDWKKQENVFFIFGQETKGLPEEIRKEYFDTSIKIPMKNIRSLNLSNVAAIVLHQYAIANNYFDLD